MMLHIQNVKNDDKQLPAIMDIVRTVSQYEDVVEIFAEDCCFDSDGYITNYFYLHVVSRPGIAESIAREIVNCAIAVEEKHPEFHIFNEPDDCERDHGVILWSRNKIIPRTEKTGCPYTIQNVKSDDRRLPAIIGIVKIMSQCEEVIEIFADDCCFDSNGYTTDTLYLNAISNYNKETAAKVVDAAMAAEEKYPEFCVALEPNTCEREHGVVLWSRE